MGIEEQHNCPQECLFRPDNVHLHFTQSLQ